MLLLFKINLSKYSWLKSKSQLCGLFFFENKCRNIFKNLDKNEKLRYNKQVKSICDILIYIFMRLIIRGVVYEKYC